jgi:hypothetical protein
MDRIQLAQLPVPPAEGIFKPIPHIEVVDALVETLGFRNISVVREEFAASDDGMRMFGVMELETSFNGCRFAVGLRNSNDKSLRLGLTVGYRVFVCDNLAFTGDFTPVLAKHTKNYNMLDSLSIGVDRMQRNFGPMVEQVENWKAERIDDRDAKNVIYEAFIEGALEVPKHLARSVHDHYFNPVHEDFAGRTQWSLSNAFTSAFKELDGPSYYKATAKLGTFLNRRLLPA